MKKFTILLFLIWTVPAFAQSSSPLICEGSGIRTIQIIDQEEVTVIRELNNFRNYPRGDHYELCFVYSGQLPLDKRWTKITSAPLQVPLTTDKSVIISGLDLRRTDKSLDKASPLFLTNDSQLTLHKSKFTCAPNSKPNSVGIKLLGDAHEVIDSEIQNCGVGIQVGDASATGNNNLITETKIHDNNTGIKVANGQGNRIEKNSIYKNNGDNNTIFSQTEGIKLDFKANGDIVPPALINTSGEIAKTDAPILSYPEGVTDLPEDDRAPVLASFKIKMPFPIGKMEVSLVLPNQQDPYNILGSQPFQGAQFINEALCSIHGAEYTCQLPMTKAMGGKLAVMLFHEDTFGTSTYSERVTLNDPTSTIPISGSPGPIVGGAELTSSGDNGESGELSGDGGSAIVASSGGVEGAGAASAKCSLTKNAPLPKHFYLTFVIPLIIFFTWRIYFLLSSNKHKEALCRIRRRVTEKSSHE